jgi:AcrR family transcriptional regulator
MPKAGPRSQFQKSEETRQALVRAAVEMIAEVGYAATTTTLISQRAGVSRGALQHHFRSKNDIMLAILNEMSQQVNVGLDAGPLVALPLDERIDRLLNHYYAAYGTRLHFAALQIWLNALRDPELRRSVHYGLTMVDRAVLEAWRATFPETDLDDRNLMAVRRVIIGTIRGSTIHEMWSNEKDSSANDLAVLKAFLKFHLAAQ